jgi:hypothetical protein
MVKVYRGELSIEDLARAGKSTQVRTAVTPWGMDGIGLKRYVGSPVWWKGRKCPGAAEKTEAEIKAALSAPKNMAAGVKKIASISKGVVGVTGAALVSIVGKKRIGKREIPYQKRGLIPTRAAMIAEAHGKSVVLERAADHVTDVIKPATYPEVIVAIPV